MANKIKELGLVFGIHLKRSDGNEDCNVISDAAASSGGYARNYYSKEKLFEGWKVASAL